MKKNLRSLAMLLLCVLCNSYIFAQTSYTLGTGTTANGSNTYPTPYNDYWEGSRMQYLFLASELSAAGMTAGNISAVKWNVTALNSITTMENWEMKIGNTATTSITAWQTGLTTVIPASNFVPSLGVNTHTFTSSFYWNGSSNIIIEVCNGDPANASATYWSNNASVAYSTLTYNASMTYATDNLGNLCGTASLHSQGSQNNRPNTVFVLTPTSPCLAPSPSTGPSTSTTVNASWGAITGATNYEYAVTTAATPPASGTLTATTSATVTGLIPATNYYFHVRTKCTSPSQSAWASIPVSTNPPCTKPSGIILSDLNVDAATVSFRRLKHATGYTYVVDMDRSTPTSTTATTNTTDSSIKLKQLTEGTKYYVHIRVMCQGGELSDWMLDSFTTLITCRPPQLSIDNIDANRAVIYWSPVPSAIKYEYEISQSPTPIGEGTSILYTSFQAFPLKDNQTYYFHVRSRCIDQGRAGTSDWNTTSFRTFPTSVSSVNKDQLSVQVFPNPVKDILTVKLNGAKAGTASVMITDITGKVLRIVTMQNDTLEVDMSSYTTGIYLVKFTDNLHTETIRVVKK